jgi:hypothetical protein
VDRNREASGWPPHRPLTVRTENPISIVNAKRCFCDTSRHEALLPLPLSDGCYVLDAVWTSSAWLSFVMGEGDAQW